MLYPEWPILYGVVRIKDAAPCTLCQPQRMGYHRARKGYYEPSMKYASTRMRYHCTRLLYQGGYGEYRGPRSGYPAKPDSKRASLGRCAKNAEPPRMNCSFAISLVEDRRHEFLRAVCCSVSCGGCSSSVGIETVTFPDKAIRAVRSEGALHLFRGRTGECS